MRAFVTLLVLCCTTVVAQAQQAALFEEIRTVSSAVVPVVSSTFTVTAAGAHDIVLTDLGAQFPTPAPLTAVHLALIRGSTIVATLDAFGTKQVQLDVGDYVLHVVGEPGEVAGSGPFSAAVLAAGTAQAVFSFAGTLSAAATVLPGHVRLFQGNTTLPAGNYTAELVDLTFPQSLVNASLLIAPAGGAPAAILDLPGAPPATASSANFTASAGNFAIFALGDSPEATNAGLFVIRIRETAGGAIVFSQVLPVGQVTSLGNTQDLAAGQYTLASADLAFPAALVDAGVLLTNQSVEAARTSSTGSSTFTVSSAGPHEVYALAIPGTSPGGGALAVDVRSQAGAVQFSSVRTAGGAGGASVFAFPVDVVDTGGYVAEVADLNFAASLSAINVAVVQGANPVLGRRDTAGSLNVSLVPGRTHLLVYAAPAFTTGGLQQTTGLFNVQLAPTIGAAIFQATQGVGGVFNARSFHITTQGDYRFTLDDLGFPSNFGELAAAVTRGSQRLGLIYGEGSFSVLQAPAGDYFINFIARPDATTKAGTYLLSAGTKPPDPEITLTANPVSPAPGATVVLTWSAQNATSCTASSSWTGSRPTSGTETSPAISASSTFTLACTGPGGSATKSLTVAPTPPDTSGGGGRLDMWLLAGLAALVFLRTLWSGRRRMDLGGYWLYSPKRFYVRAGQ